MIILREVCQNESYGGLTRYGHSPGMSIVFENDKMSAEIFVLLTN